MSTDSEEIDPVVAAGPLATVEHTPPLPPKYGLLAALGGDAAVVAATGTRPHDAPGDHWENGYTLWPEENTSTTTPIDICDLPTMAPPATTAGIDVEPFGIWEGVKASTIGRTEAELVQRSEDKLFRFTSYKLEHELWYGTWTQGDANGNQYLTSGAVDVGNGATLSLIDGLAWLQEEVANTNGGSQAMIHVPLIIGTWLFTLGAIRWRRTDTRDLQLTDAYGNIIVAGGGYSTPASGVGHIYATDIVDVFLSDIETHTVVKPSDNVRHAISTRVAGLSWDSFHFGVTVDLTNLSSGTSPSP